MKVKICGLNPSRDVQLCIDLGVNFLGFVFYTKSPRHVSLQDIEILKTYNRLKSKFVAVTVNPSNEFIENIVQKHFDYIQLHGSETKNRITQIKNMGFKIIKAIKIKNEQDINNYREFDNADIVLFDTPGMEKSLEFPKNLIKKLPIGTKYALAGSVSEDNVEKISSI